MKSGMEWRKKTLHKNKRKNWANGTPFLVKKPLLQNAQVQRISQSRHTTTLQHKTLRMHHIAC